MYPRIILALAVAAVTAACEQDSQQLPFGPSDDAVTASVSIAGGVVTSAKGASIIFPAQSLTSATAVTVTPTSTPAPAAALGTPVSAGSFTFGPVDASLNAPADVELQLAAAHRQQANAWLASLVNVRGGVATSHGLGDVDLATGIVRTAVSELGTMTLVIPGEGSVVPLIRQTGTPAAVQATAGAEVAAEMPTLIHGRCAVAPCPPEGRITASLVAPTGALRDLEQAAIVFWRFTGGFDVHAGGNVTGQIDADFPVRVRMTPSRAGAIAPVASVPFRVRLEPTATTTAVSTSEAVRLTSTRITLDWGSGTSTMVQDLVISRAGGGQVTLQRTFHFDGQPIGIRAVVPVTIQ
jgi:hypothetical protein